MNRFFQKRSTAISVVILFFGINCAGLGQRDMVIRGNPSHLRVLEEPMPEAEDFAGRDTLALRQARAAAELVRLGRGSMVWHLLQESSDNSLRTYLIRELGTVDPPVVFRQLERGKRCIHTKRVNTESRRVFRSATSAHDESPDHSEAAQLVSER